jgi:cytoskeletal protein CcmA (bactofilin family)
MRTNTQTKERAMFGKSKDDNDQLPSATPSPQPSGPPQSPAATKSAGQVSTEPVSTISRGMTVVGKISGEGTLNVFGRVEGELRASNVVINEGASVEGDVIAEDLTVGGQVKGAIHASRVRLNGTAVVEGDIFHRSLSIEENARFEGSSKREDNAIEVTRVQPKRPVADLSTKVAAIENTRKPNGASQDALATS